MKVRGLCAFFTSSPGFFRRGLVQGVCVCYPSSEASFRTLRSSAYLAMSLFSTRWGRFSDLRYSLAKISRQIVFYYCWE